MNAPKAVTGLGCAFLALSVLVLAVSIVLPLATSGRTSWDEAMWGIIPGAVCSGISFLTLLIGAIWMLFSRRRS
jgi:Na+-transporting NADH:ubiquinone oxidoreductase subunit NqrB